MGSRWERVLERRGRGEREHLSPVKFIDRIRCEARSEGKQILEKKERSFERGGKAGKRMEERWEGWKSDHLPLVKLWIGGIMKDMVRH